MNRTYQNIAAGFFAAEDFVPMLKQMRLDSVEAIFKFDNGQPLTKSNLARWRHRLRFQLPNGCFAYLKRYDAAPARVQVRSWMQHRKRAFLSECDVGPEAIIQAGLNIPVTIAFGGHWSGLFEKCSFIISLEIPNGQSLETALPECFTDMKHNASQKRLFVNKTADFVRRFHATGYRHRDLYLCHLFLCAGETLYLIDLHRCFKPYLLAARYAVKDLAQLHYSCPAGVISRTDRLRFFLNYRGHEGLSAADKKQIRKIHRKARMIARRDRRHGRTAPFERASARETVTC